MHELYYIFLAVVLLLILALCFGLLTIRCGFKYKERTPYALIAFFATMIAVFAILFGLLKTVLIVALVAIMLVVVKSISWSRGFDDCHNIVESCFREVEKVN